jgi:thiazole synthase
MQNGMAERIVDNARTEQSQPVLKVGSFELASRLVVGTGKYASYAEMAECLDASGTDCVTVAVRRERLLNTAGENILDHLDLARYTLLPNTAGCFSADDAVRVARLGRELLRDLGNKGSEWVKLEVLGDQKTLLPDPVGTIEATQRLVDDGFTVLVYSSDDPMRLPAGITLAAPRSLSFLATIGSMLLYTSAVNPSSTRRWVASIVPTGSGKSVF